MALSCHFPVPQESRAAVLGPASGAAAVIVPAVPGVQVQSAHLTECGVLRRTLELVLRGDWAELAEPARAALEAAVAQCETALDTPQVAAACTLLRRLLPAPWDQPLLKRILNKQHVDDQQGLLCNRCVCDCGGRNFRLLPEIPWIKF